MLVITERSSGFATCKDVQTRRKKNGVTRNAKRRSWPYLNRRSSSPLFSLICMHRILSDTKIVWLVKYSPNLFCIRLTYRVVIRVFPRRDPPYTKFYALRDQFPERRISGKEITDETEKCTVGMEKAGGNVKATRNECTKVRESLAELCKRRVSRPRRNLRKEKRKIPRRNLRENGETYENVDLRIATRSLRVLVSLPNTLNITALNMEQLILKAPRGKRRFLFREF